LENTVSDGRIRRIDAVNCRTCTAAQSIHEGTKRVSRLKQEMPVRWNSCLAMLRSLVAMRKEVDNCLKMIGQYDKCLKGSEWAAVEELVKFLSHFEDLTDIVSTKVTSLSLIQLIRREIQDITVAKSTDCEEVEQLKQLIIRNLEKRLPLTDDVKLATLLDPSTKDLVPIDHAEKVDLLVKAATDMSLMRSSVVAPSAETGDCAVSSADGSVDTDQNDLVVVSRRRRLLQKHRVETQSGRRHPYRSEHVPADESRCGN